MRLIHLVCISCVFLLNFSSALANSSQLAEKTFLLVKQNLDYSVQECKDVKIRVYIPQEDEFQKIISIKASHPFEKVSDEYGNILLEFTPKRKDTIKIETIVSISRRYVKVNEKDFEKFAEIAKKVYEMLEYDKKFANVVLSPKEILEKKKGTCDEFSTLMIYFLRKNGLNATYEVGYAYDGFSFHAHGWVRVKENGNTFDFDPTWCEYPVDALHIKFASLPNAFFNETEVRAKCFENGKISLSPQTVEIEILNISYSPLIYGNLSFLEEKAKYNSYALGKLELFSDGCALTSLNFGKCVNENGDIILEPFVFPECVYFCSKKKVFAVFKAHSAEYSAECKISVKPSLGNLTSTKILLEEGKRENVWLNVSKNVVNRCEVVLLRSNGHIFTLDGFYAFKKGYLSVCKNITIYALKDSITQAKITVRNVREKSQIENKSKFISNKTIVKEKISQEIEEEEKKQEQEKTFIDIIIEFFRGLLSFLT